RDLRLRRRRRFVRVGIDLRVADRPRRPMGGRMRRGAWRAGDDDPRRHEHGDPGGRRTRDERWNRTGDTMTREAVVGRMIEVGIVPVLRAQSPDEAIAVADAIAAGGIDVLEITMTVPGAVQVIAQVVKRYGDRVLVGAGTVLDAKAASECL